MAVDKKSNHVGNHGGAYTDIDGQSRQFTYVDHDKKTKKSTSKPLDDSQKEQLKQQVLMDQQRTIDEILALPAVALLKSKNIFAEDFIIRDQEKGIIWNETFTRNALTINTDLAYSIRNSVWKNTVREQFWSEDMSHEDILVGKWMDWI